MNKKELVREIARESGSTIKSADMFLSTFTEVVMRTLENNDKVQIVGFGEFYSRTRAERRGTNPITGEKITIPTSKYPIFKAGSTLRSRVKGIKK